MSLLRMVTSAHEAHAADLARMVAAHERAQREIARLRHDRDALVTCVITLIGFLDQAGPEVHPEIRRGVEQARRVAGNCPPVDLGRPGELPAAVLSRAFTDAFGRRRAGYVCSACGAEFYPNDGRDSAGRPHASCSNGGGVWERMSE